MSNAAGYFFDLALQTRCRKSKQQKTSCRKWQATLTYEPQFLPGGTGDYRRAFPPEQVSQQKVCQDIAGESNIFAAGRLPGRDVPLAGNLTASGISQRQG